MASFNRVILVGNLTRDVEIKYLQAGTAVTEIGLAVNDRVKKNNEWVDETTFVDITLWGRTAEIASEYLNKGSSVLIEGRLKLDSWEKDGKKNYKLRVVGERMQMLGGKGGGGGGSGGGGGAGRGQQRGGAGGGPPGPDESESYGGGEYEDSGPQRGRQGGGASAAPKQAEEDIPF
jgi:single-strand DNA-binding protein